MSPRKRANPETQRPRLSYEQVIQTALLLVDREGLENFSMRKLGAELGVDPMAIYYYIPNKSAVLDSLVEAVMAEQVFSYNPQNDWRQNLTQVAREYRRVLRAHPNVLPVISTRPVTTRTGLRQIEFFMQVIIQAGFTLLQAPTIIDIMGAFIVGHALAEVGRPPLNTPDIGIETMKETLEQLPADEFPLLSQAMQNGLDYNPDGQFEQGLKVLLDGLAQMRAVNFQKVEG